MAIEQELVRELLSGIVKTKPDLSVKDYKWLIGILKDQYNPKRDYQHVDCIKEINGLALCLLWGVVDSIKNNSNQNLETTEASALLQHLVKDYSQQEDLARWCLESWCIVLGKYIDLSVVDRLTAPLEIPTQIPLLVYQSNNAEQTFINLVKVTQQNSQLDDEILIELSLEGKKLGLSESKIKRLFDSEIIQKKRTLPKNHINLRKTSSNFFKNKTENGISVKKKLLILLIVIVFLIIIVISYKGPYSYIFTKNHDNSITKVRVSQKFIDGLSKQPGPPPEIDESKRIMSGDWSMFGHDPQHTNRSSYLGPKNLDIELSDKTYNCNYSSPAFNVDNRFYFGADSKFQSRDMTSNPFRYFPTQSDIKSSPAIGTDGSLYFGCDDYNLYAVNFETILSWSFQAEDKIRSSPVLDASMNIYFGCNDHYFYSINQEGKLNWKYLTNGSIQSSPALGADGSVYFGSDDNNLYCLSLDGKVKWIFSTGGVVQSSPSIGLDATILVGSFDSYVYAISPIGKLKWRFKTKGSIEATPAIATDGTIYIGSYDGHFYALTPNGKTKWEYKTGDKIVFSAAISAEGTVHFGSDDSFIYAFDPVGTKKWSYKTNGKITTSPTINRDGQILCFTSSGSLYFTNQGEHEFSLNPPEIKASDKIYPNKVMIEISPVQTDPISDGFYIYRAIKDFQIYQYIGKTSSLQFEDTNVEAGKRYLYKAKSSKFTLNYDDSEYSNIVEGSTL